MKQDITADLLVVDHLIHIQDNREEQPTQPGAPLVSGAGGTNYGNAGGEGMDSNPGVGGGGGGSELSGRPGDTPPAGRVEMDKHFLNIPDLYWHLLFLNECNNNRSDWTFAGGGAGGPGAPETRPGGAGGGGSSGPGTSASDETDATGYGSGGSGTQFGSSNTNASPAGTAGVVIVKYSS